MGPATFFDYPAILDLQYVCIACIPTEYEQDVRFD